MDVRTRTLVACLADDTTQAVLDALSDGPATLKELTDATGGARQTLHALLRRLVAFGVVGYRHRASEGGRPPREWFLAASAAMAAFEQAAIELERALVDIG